MVILLSGIFLRLRRVAATDGGVRESGKGGKRNSRGASIVSDIEWVVSVMRRVPSVKIKLDWMRVAVSANIEHAQLC